jgi:hypothetical protein
MGFNSAFKGLNNYSKPMTLVQNSMLEEEKPG